MYYIRKCVSLLFHLGLFVKGVYSRNTPTTFEPRDVKIILLCDDYSWEYDTMAKRSKINHRQLTPGYNAAVGCPTRSDCGESSRPGPPGKASVRELELARYL